MQYCRNCKVNYQTPLKHCLFCNNELVDAGTVRGKKDGKLLWEGVELTSGFHYPKITRENHGFFMFRRIVLFLFVLANTICLYLNYSIRDPKKTLHGMGWSLLVLGVSFYIIGILNVAGRNLMKRIKVIWYALMTIAILFWIGMCVGEYQWALDYLLPFGLMITEFYATVLLIGGKRKLFDAAIYVFWLALFGLVFVSIIKQNLIQTQWACVTCEFYSGFTLFNLFFWGRKEFLEELKRRFYF